MTEQQTHTFIPEWQNLAQADCLLSYFARSVHDRREQARLASNTIEHQALIDAILREAPIGDISWKIRFQMQGDPVIQIGKTPQPTDTNSGAFTTAAIMSLMGTCHVGLFDVPNRQQARETTTLLNTCLGNTPQDPLGKMASVAVDKNAVMRGFFARCLKNPDSVWHKIITDKALLKKFQTHMGIQTLFQCQGKTLPLPQTADKLATALEKGEVTPTPKFIEIALHSANMVVISDQHQSRDSTVFKHRWTRFAAQLGVSGIQQILPDICFDGIFTVRDSANRPMTLGQLANTPIQVKKKIIHHILHARGKDLLPNDYDKQSGAILIQKGRFIENPNETGNDWQRAACY